MSTELAALTSARVRLRRIAADEVAAVFAIFSDARAMRYWSRPPMQVPAEAAALIQQIDDCRARGDLLQWGIERREDAELIGTCTLAAIDRTHGRAEIGFILRSDCWGQGFAAEALARLLQHARDDMQLRRIEADVDPRNRASLRVLGKLGFRQEGYLPQRWHVGAELQDSVLLGLLLQAPMAKTGFRVSTRLADVDVDLVHRYLSLESYWAPGIPRAVVERALQHSRVYAGLLDGRQVAFARVISDGATFANLVDVFVLPEHRGRGYSARLLEAILADPDLQGLRRFMLATRDAHGLYARYGFVPVEGSQVLMQRYQPNVYARQPLPAP